MKEGNPTNRGRGMLIRSVAYLLAGLLLIGSIPAASIKTHAAQADSDIIYIDTIVSQTAGGDNIGGTKDAPVVVSNGDMVYINSVYSAKYLKIIRDMVEASTASQKYRLPMSKYIAAKTDLAQDIIVHAGGKAVKVGTLNYQSADPNGLYITYNLGDKASEDTGLYALLKASLGVSMPDIDSVVADTEAYPNDSDATLYAGELSYEGSVDIATVDYDKALELKNMNSTNGWIEVKDPDAPVNPKVTKTGEISEEGKLVWTIEVEKNMTSPEHYLLTDVLPDLTKLPAVTPKIMVSVDSAAYTDIVIGSSEMPSENQAYYDSATKRTVIDVTFSGTQKKRTYKIYTDVDGGTADNNLLGKAVSNTAKIKDLTDKNLPEVPAEGTIHVPGVPTIDNISKQGVLTTDGKINWTIQVKDVNAGFMKYMTIYDKLAADWKITSELTVKKVDASGAVIASAALSETKLANPGNPSTAITATKGGTGTTIASGFRLTPFDDSLTPTGTRAGGYYITYTSEPVDPDYWKTHDEADAKTDNTVWMDYEWKTGVGPGKAELNGPSITEFPVGSPAVSKTFNSYDRKTSLFDWTVVVNPHAIPMTSEIALTDTMGQGMCLNISADPKTGTSPYTLSAADIEMVFGTANKDNIAGATYRYDDANGYSFTASIKESAVNDGINGKTLTLEYQTRATDSSKFAGNVNSQKYNNKAELSYTISGGSRNSSVTTEGELGSRVIEKTCLGYDYNTAAVNGTASTLKWQVVVNQNQMVLADSNNQAAITDLIEETQELVVSASTPITVASTDTTGTWGLSGKVWTSLDAGVNGETPAAFTGAENGLTKLTVDFGKPANINSQTLTITFYTKLKDITAFFTDVDGKSLTGNTAYNGKTENDTMDGKGAVLHSKYSAVEDNASWAVYNKMLEKTFVSRDSKDPVVTYVVGINPMQTRLEDNFTIVDTMAAGLSLDPASFELYETVAANSGAVSDTGDRSKVVDVTTGTDATNLIKAARGQLTLSAEADGRAKFSYNFQFGNTGWGSDANSKTYVLRYKALITSTDFSVSFGNEVKVGGDDYTAQLDDASIHYSYNYARINGYAGSYGSIKITKQTTAAGNAAYGGATFTITDQYGQTRTATTNASGVATFALLPSYSTYKIVETAAPAGFATAGLPRTIAEGVKITIADNKTLTFTYEPSADNLTGTLSPAMAGGSEAKSYSFYVRNHPIPFVVSFMKKDQYNRAVSGAVFNVYAAADTGCVNMLATGVSNAGGIVLFDLGAETLRAGAYKCRESSAPADITFDPLTAKEYYFTVDAYGQMDGLHEDSQTGALVGAVVNHSNTPPASQPPEPNTPSTPSRPHDPDEDIVWESEKPKPSAVQINSTEILGKKLPKTGGFVGSAALFLLGASLVGTGAYLNKKGKKQDDEKTGRD